MVAVDANHQPSRPNIMPSSPFTSWQYWYDPSVLFHNILSSYLATTKMHFGMARYVDQPTELWHSRAWGSSIRAASGEFASASTGNILFPSDFVHFESIQIPGSQIWVEYGRISFIGLDQRSNSHMNGQVVLTLDPIAHVTALSQYLTPRNSDQLSN
jgi:hypothetical protein